MKTLTDKLNIGDVSVVGEGDPDFYAKAEPEEIQVTETAQKLANVAPAAPTDGSDFKKEEARRKLSLAREDKNEDDRTIHTVDGTAIAKYKIEVMFGHSRRLSGDNLCAITVWESGRKFHGGGDQLMFVCTDTSEPDPRKRGGCGGYISPDDIVTPPSLNANGDAIGGVAFCRSCNKNVVASKLGVQYTMQASPKKIAEKLETMFHQLHNNCDIYLKFHKNDMRYIAMERAKGPDVAKRLKGMALYPLKNIIKDVANGASLSDRFRAFITA